MSRLLTLLLLSSTSGWSQLLNPLEETQVSVETSQLSDGSTLKELTFTTTPGVNYHIWHSTDLENWALDRSFYGLGHEISIPMHHSEPPGSAPSSPPATLENPPVSIWLNPISGTSSDYLLSWISLEFGTPTYRRLDGALTSSWLNSPLSSHRLTDFQIYVALGDALNGSEVPSDSEIWDLDLDLINDFLAHIPDMNSDMGAGNFSSQEGISPGASASEQNFWKITADWNLDTDDDGSPDWMELIVADTPGHPDASLANVFTIDSNNNGIPDGHEIDGDSDTIPDYDDANKREPAVDWARPAQAPKYGAFEFAIPIVSPRGPESTRPMQVNSLGQVLFPVGVWQNGTLQNLTLQTPEIQWSRPIGFNNSGQIIGLAQTSIPDVSNPPTGGGPQVSPGAAGICYWEDSTSAPVLVTVEIDGDDVLALNPGWDETALNFPHDSVIDDDGRFIGKLNLPSPSRAYFTKVAGGFQSAPIPADQEKLLFVLNPDVAWGLNSAEEPLIMEGASAKIMDFGINKVIRKPLNNRLLASGFRLNQLTSQMNNGTWELAKIGSCTDITQTGLWIYRDKNVYFRSVEFQQEPNFVAPKLPAEWNVDPGLFDSSPNDHFIGRRQVTSEEPYKTSVYFPFAFEDDLSATGVDHHSALAISGPALDRNKPDAEGRYWAMAPANAGPGGENTLRIHSPATAENPITLTAPGVNITPSVLNAPVTEVTLGGINNATQDVDLQISKNNMTAISQPLGIKVMKKRTVKVTVWIIALAKPGGTGTDDRYKPNLEFTKENIEEELNRVFGKQVNTFFEVTVRGALSPYRIAFDIGQGPPESQGNGALDLAGGSDSNFPGPGAEGNLIMNVDNQTRYDDSASINIYIIGSDSPTVRWSADDVGKNWGGANGVAMPLHRTVWVTGMSEKLNPTPEELSTNLSERLLTLAHEVGHIMVGGGHPGEGPDIVGLSGISPLPGTDHRKRLMYSNPGTLLEDRDVLLVKKEWDEIEEWLLKEEAVGRITQ